MAIVDELIALLGYEIKGEEEAKKFQKSLDALEKKAYAFGSAIRMATVAAGTALVGGLGLMAKGAIDTGSEFEMLGIQLEALEGSKEKAKAALSWIEDFAVKTPLQLQEVVQGYTQLRTYGLEPTNGTFQALVDTMAMSGKGSEHLSGLIMAVGQAWTKQKLQGEEAMQLLERGVPVWDLLSTAMGKTVPQIQDLASKGKLGRKEIALLVNEMGKRAAGASDNFSKALEGIKSNIGDLWTGFKREIADAGYFDYVKGQFKRLLDYITALKKDGTLKRWAETISKALVIAGQAVERFGRVLAKLANLGALKPIIATLGIMLALMFPLIAKIALVAAVIDDLLAYLEGGESVIGSFIEWLRAIIPGAGAVEDAILSLVGGVTAGLAAAFLVAPLTTSKLLLSGIISIIVSLGGAILSGLAGLAPMVVSGLASAFALLSNPIGWGIILAGVAAALIYYFWDDIVAGWNTLSTKATELFGQLKDWFLNIDWTGVGMSMITALWEGMKSLDQAIQGWFLSLIPDWAKQWIGGGGVSSAVPSSPAASNGQDPEWLKNMHANIEKTGSIQAGGAVANDNRQDNRSFPVSVNAPVTVQVQQASDAPAAVGGAISRAVGQGAQAQPARMQSGPAL